MQFSCTANQAANRTVLTVAGELDLAAHDRFKADVDLFWGASTDLVLDCSQVTFLDSMGLRVLVHAMQRASDTGRVVSLAAPSTAVLRVLELAGVDSLFPIEPAAQAEPDLIG